MRLPWTMLTGLQVYFHSHLRENSTHKRCILRKKNDQRMIKFRFINNIVNDCKGLDASLFVFTLRCANVNSCVSQLFSFVLF